jgi:RNA polymerase sigma-70 factor, ECF subfamily
MTDDTSFAGQAQTRASWQVFINDIAPIRPQLLRYCSGLTGNLWDGEDLLQDVLLRVFGQLGKSHDDLVNPRGYILQSATHLWIDRLRRVRRERDYVAAESEHPDEHASPAAQIVDVRAAANVLFINLAPRERAAVLLADVLDLSLQEAASMLKTTEGAVKSALHRGRARLTSANAASEQSVARAPRETVDRFVAALNDRNFEAIRALCLDDVTIDMVGGTTYEGFEKGKITLEFAHFVNPAMGFGESPHWQTIDYLGEALALGFRTLGGVEGVNDIWRIEMGDGDIACLRLYCFSPDVLAAVAKDLGLPALRRPYRPPS